jgi:hypothetical protein
LVQGRGLDAAEGKVQAVGQGRARQFDRVGVSALGRPVKQRAARVAQSDRPGDLVEGLAGRVVAGAGQI